MPAIRSYSIEPIRKQSRALLPEREAEQHPLEDATNPAYPIGGSLREAASGGFGVRMRLHHRLAEDESCSEKSTPLRLHGAEEWIEAGVMDALREMALAAHDDRTIGLELTEIAADGCITKAPCGSD